MRRWFERLPIHRKLVTLALLVSGASLVIAVLGLSLIDLWRYRAAASEDATALARVLAENSAAAVAFNDTDAALKTLESVRARNLIVRACIYLPDGRLFSGFGVNGVACPPGLPHIQGWDAVGGAAPALFNGREYGTVYVERALSDLGARLALAAMTGLVMLVVAGVATFALAQRVHRAISQPISDLAETARRFGRDHTIAVPPIDAPPDEVGDLVASFREMVAQVQAASDELTNSNAALRHENEQRRRVEAEREQALVREREANRLKDEFLAAVSHELRTPLHAMVGWAHVLQSTKGQDPVVGRAAARIVKNAEAQTRVIEDLLDVSRIVTGKLRLEFRVVDLRAVVSSALDALQGAAAAKGVRLAIAVPGEGCFVMGDRDRLQQVLWNLLSNAVKFTPRDGQVTIDLACEREVVVVTVSDTGIGIATDFVAHVFERFRQADGSFTREHGGLGLGLAIVKELTELHGGTVSAASEGRGRGARFFVRLPRATAPAMAPAIAEAGAAAPLPALDNVSVLAVDDDEDALAIVTAALTGAGAEVEAATSAAAAVAAWEHRPRTVLVCDLAMPQTSGFDLLRRIRAIDARRAAETRAIAVSAHASADDHARSLAAGFLQHLSKPVSTAEIVRAVARAADRLPSEERPVS